MIIRYKISLFLFIGLLAVISVAVIFEMRQGGVFASESSPKGEAVASLSRVMDLYGNGKMQSVVLTTYHQNNKYQSQLTVKDGFWRKRSINLAGFEQEAYLCLPETIELSGGDRALCITGFVGVHSQNIQIIDLKNMLPIKFLDQTGVMRDNMVTDAPNYLLDKDKDKISIIIDNRNYDKDPIIDIKREYYYLKDNVFRFDQEELISEAGSIK